LLLFYSALSVLPYLMCLFNVISVITTSSNHTRLVDFSAPLLESPFALMKACCQLAETLVLFLLLQQLSEDFYYYLSCWLVLQHECPFVAILQPRLETTFGPSYSTVTTITTGEFLIPIFKIIV